jgi:hypothetical protein
MHSAHRTVQIVAGIAVGSLLLAAVVDARTSRPQKKGATYSGFTSQGTDKCRTGDSNTAPCSIFANVSKSGGTVTTMLIYYFAPCTDGKVLRSTTVFRNRTISKTGKYSNASSYTETLGDGTKAANTVTMHGKFTHKTKYKLKGDYSIVSDLTFTDGSTTQCKSGPVTFGAKPK